MKLFIRTFAVIALATLCTFTAKTNAGTYNGFDYTETDQGIEITRGPNSGNITIPESIDSKPVVSIGDGAFYVSDITGVTIPESVTTLKHGAFKYCQDLKSVYFVGNGIEVIGDEAFDDCRALSSINFPTSITTIESRAFVNCAALPDVDISHLSITTIGSNVFSGCNKMTTLKLPDSLTDIPDHFSFSCDNLTTIVLGNKTTSIGESAFSHNFKLTTINFPDTLTSIGDYSFYCAESLTTLKFPDSVTTIGECAFDDSGLNTIYCSYNLYAYNYFKNGSLTIITGNPDIDNKTTTTANTENANNNNNNNNNYYSDNSSSNNNVKRHLNYTRLEITSGFSAKLILYNAKGKVKWKSSNKKVASVNKKGVVKAKKTGKAVIIAKNGKKKYKCKIKVYANKAKLSGCSIRSLTGFSLSATAIEKKGKYYIITYKLNNYSGHKLKNLSSMNFKLINGTSYFYKLKSYSSNYAPRTFKVKYKATKKLDLRNSIIYASTDSTANVYYYIRR